MQHLQGTAQVAPPHAPMQPGVAGHPPLLQPLTFTTAVEVQQTRQQAVGVTSENLASSSSSSSAEARQPPLLQGMAVHLAPPVAAVTPAAARYAGMALSEDDSSQGASGASPLAQAWARGEAQSSSPEELGSQDHSRSQQAAAGWGAVAAAKGWGKALDLDTHRGGEDQQEEVARHALHSDVHGSEHHVTQAVAQGGNQGQRLGGGDEAAVEDAAWLASIRARYGLGV
ncbi:hypothetical protein V8C86DRAFT_2748873 [Haematococcus lacustris]